jgi:predicted transcriptional regulator
MLKVMENELINMDLNKLQDMVKESASQLKKQATVGGLASAAANLALSFGYLSLLPFVVPILLGGGLLYYGLNATRQLSETPVKGPYSSALASAVRNEKLQRFRKKLEWDDVILAYELQRKMSEIQRKVEELEQSNLDNNQKRKLKSVVNRYQKVLTDPERIQSKLNARLTETLQDLQRLQEESQMQQEKEKTEIELEGPSLAVGSESPSVIAPVSAPAAVPEPLEIEKPPVEHIPKPEIEISELKKPVIEKSDIAEIKPKQEPRKVVSRKNVVLFLR